MFETLLVPDLSNLAPLLGPAWLWGWGMSAAFARLLGLLVLSPIFGQRGVSLWMRTGLAGCLAFIVTPVIVSGGAVVVPGGAAAAIVQLACEFTLGALLGFGVLFVFAGLKLAGELVDQQAGGAVQEVFDPQGAGGTTPAGQLLTIVATLALLSVAPGEGYLRILSTLLDSFVMIPADVVWDGDGVLRLVCALGQSSLLLGLQVAAPVLAAGAIVSWGVAQLGGTGGSPYAATLLGLPVRVVVSLGILTMCLSGATEALLMSAGGLLDRFSVLLGRG